MVNSMPSQRTVTLDTFTLNTPRKHPLISPLFSRNVIIKGDSVKIHVEFRENRRSFRQQL